MAPRKTTKKKTPPTAKAGAKTKAGAKGKRTAKAGAKTKAGAKGKRTAKAGAKRIKETAVE